MNCLMKLVGAVCLVSSCCLAQSSCRLTAIKSSGTLKYPVIAMAAHVSGDLVLHATFDRDGSVASVDVVSGPALLYLREIATAYIKSWKVNESAEAQSCDISLSFQFRGSPVCEVEPSVVTMTDLQHFTIATPPVQTCDPSNYTVSHFQPFQRKTKAASGHQ
jgi:hypothetical protein